MPLHNLDRERKSKSKEYLQISWCIVEKGQSSQSFIENGITNSDDQIKIHPKIFSLHLDYK